MILIDHRSMDRTPEILARLRAEGAPIEVIRHPDQVMVQTEVSSRVMQRAASQHDAGIVCEHCQTTGKRVHPVRVVARNAPVPSLVSKELHQ